MHLQTSTEKFHALGANVLPIKNGKIPAIEWVRFQTERQSSEEVGSYDWMNCTGIGIVCGFDNYVCFDFDHLKNEAVIFTVLDKLGVIHQYDWQVKTGSGVGRHIWVRTAGPLPFEKGVVWGRSKDGSFDHVEIRWKDCQTLIPPSLHESGRQYEWLYAEPTIEPMMVSADAIINAFGAVAFLREAERKKEKPKYSKTKYVELLVNGVDEGQRNDSLTSFAGLYVFKVKWTDFQFC
jgi:hypothetical protein